MIVLVLGSGGRENALCKGLERDPSVQRVHAAPGNPGIANSHPVNLADPAAVDALARRLGADLIVIGPEVPLVAGLAGQLRALGHTVFGPDQPAARLEGSKAFAKDVMAAAGVPTAGSAVCETPEQAMAALVQFGPPYVVKDDGLAAGKGVVVTTNLEQALSHAQSCVKVVIEEYLDGPEISLFAICDGTRALPLAPAQDFKRVGDHDQGPNTGGMGAYSPLPWAPPDLVDEVMAVVVEPTLAEMNRRGTPFVGLLYVGLALTSRGLRVIEFNTRFGDPETQVVIARLMSPLGVLLNAAARGQLDDYIAEHGPLRWSPDGAVVVVMAARGYPADPVTGGQIVLAPETDTAYVLHCGTKWQDDHLVCAGGRVLSVVGRGPDLAAARENAYQLVEQISFDTGFWRTDIAARAAAGELDHWAAQLTS